nr:unnamed protein product [Spirometra erinaceieuropaei]
MLAANRGLILIQMEAEYISRPEQEADSEREKPVLVDVSEERGSHERTRTDYCCKMAAPVSSSNGSNPSRFMHFLSEE